MKLITVICLFAFVACSSKSTQPTMEFTSPTPAPASTPVEYTPDSQGETEWDTAAKPSPTPVVKKKHKNKKARHLPAKEDRGS